MTTTQTFLDFKVADPSLAEWGRKEIDLAEIEMPGLMALRAENRAHHFGRPGSPGVERAKTELLECFCPDSEHWRTRVVQQGQTIIERAIGAAPDE